ncbi:MAG: hypothetical protein CFE26_20785 [Verrucomicrobiales bacterium VVV1]|nr:MAG: hypothetical protein CFE26_20785 [Verrucomicrobiales bacterium VVV1]
MLGGPGGLLSAGLISINNLRDREEDASTGKRTLAVRLGPKFAISIIWLETKVAALAGLGWIFYKHPEWMIASAPVFGLGLRIVWGIITTEPGPGYNRLLALAGVQLILFAAAFHVVAALIH